MTMEELVRIIAPRFRINDNERESNKYFADLLEKLDKIPSK
jgi:hypothetical protein